MDRLSLLLVIIGAINWGLVGSISMLFTGHEHAPSHAAADA